MALPLLLIIGGNVVRAVAPKVIQQLMRQGAKKATTQAVKKAGGASKVPTVTSVKQAKNIAPKMRTAAGVKPFKPISGAGRGRQMGEGAVQAAPKLSKPTAGVGRATLKKQPPSLKKTPPSLKKTPPALKKAPKVIPKKPIVGQGKTGVTTAEKVFNQKPRTSLLPKRPVSGSVPKGGGKTTAGPRPVGSGRSSTMRPSQQRTTTQQKPLKPGIGNIVKTGAALGTIAQGKKALEGKPSDAGKPMAMPKPKPKVQGLPKPSTKTKAAPKTKGPRIVEKTAISASKNTGFGLKGNIFPGSAGERKALMKMYGGTGKAAAKAAIAGTQGNLAAGKADYIAARNMRFKNTANNKMSGGKVGKKTKPMTKTVNKYNTTKYDTPQKDAQYTGEKKITFGGIKKAGMKTAKRPPVYKSRKPAGKKPSNPPKKYDGFSKLPEAVQNKMDPALAAKFGEGGSIKSGCARQVRGFGAARKPKK